MKRSLCIPLAVLGLLTAPKLDADGVWRVSGYFIR
jgi:hypothetical protein